MTAQLNGSATLHAAARSLMGTAAFSLLERIRLCFVDRDFSQSKTSNKIPLNSPWALQKRELVNQLNKLGLHCMLETDCGAQFQQGIMVAGRPPLDSPRDNHEVLDQDIPVRLLMRASNLFTLMALDDEMQEVALDILFRAYGAETRLVLGSIFHAGKRGTELVPPAQVIHKITTQGPVNLRTGIEVAIPYSALPRLGLPHYDAATTEALNAIEDAGLGFRLMGLRWKNFVGMYDNSNGDDAIGNVRDVVDIQINNILDFKRARGIEQPLWISQHIHNTGFADSAGLIAVKHYIDQVIAGKVSPDDISHIDVDVTANDAFVNSLGLMRSLVDQYQNRMTPTELTTCSQIFPLLEQLEAIDAAERKFYGYAFSQHKLSGEDQRFSRTAGGGAPTAERDAIIPINDALLVYFRSDKASNALLRAIQDKALAAHDAAHGERPEMDDAIKLIAGQLAYRLYKDFKNWIVEGAGDCESVTPLERSLGLAVKDMVTGVIKGLEPGEPNLLSHIIHTNLDLGAPLPQEIIERLPQLSRHIVYGSHSEELRRVSWGAKDPVIDRHLCQLRIKHVLPDNGLDKSELKNKVTDPKAYEEARNALLECANDPIQATAELGKHIDDKKFVQEFVAANIGPNKQPLNAAANARREQALREHRLTPMQEVYAALKAIPNPQVDWDQMVFAAIMMMPPPGAPSILAPETVRMIQHPSTMNRRPTALSTDTDIGPSYWRGFLDKAGLDPNDISVIELMHDTGTHTVRQLHETLVKRGRRVPNFVSHLIDRAEGKSWIPRNGSAASHNGDGNSHGNGQDMATAFTRQRTAVLGRRSGSNSADQPGGPSQG